MFCFAFVHLFVRHLFICTGAKGQVLTLASYLALRKHHKNMTCTIHFASTENLTLYVIYKALELHNNQ